jgi:hypothetical protein
MAVKLNSSGEGDQATFYLLHCRSGSHRPEYPMKSHTGTERGD